MLADPLLSLGRILGSFKLTLKPLSTLKMTSNLFPLRGVQVHLSGAQTTRTYSCQKKKEKNDLSDSNIFAAVVTTQTRHSGSGTQV